MKAIAIVLIAIGTLTVLGIVGTLETTFIPLLSLQVIGGLVSGLGLMCVGAYLLRVVRNEEEEYQACINTYKADGKPLRQHGK